MNRREFTTLAAGAGSLLGLGGFAPVALAQGGAPVEGQSYLRLSQRQPTLDPKKIEVLEFFWYGCPHCYAFEPTIDAWQKKLPADVNFRRVPVNFREVPYVAHQKLFYAIETMGLIEQLHRKVFYAIHQDHNPLDKPETMAEFMAKNGVDKTKFLEVYNSFSVQTKARQAASLSAGYKIDGTPAMGVNGQYYTSGSLAGSNERSLVVVEYLIAQSRKGG
jgi:thiol:disulfide interchange protein DsbA